MHPAKSVIAFTTLSGAGYGLLIATLMGKIIGLYSASPILEMVSLSMAFLLVTVGLLMSTLHLGHPERAWRAFSQWRSSWLSREGISSVMTFLPWTIYAFYRFWLQEDSDLTMTLGIVTSILAFTTVYTTSMIYRSIKAVQSWYNVYVTPLYLMFSLASGFTILNALLHVSQFPSTQVNNIALITIVAALVLKRGYWRSVDNGVRRSTIESATGLGRFGKVTSLEHPHSQTNYLMDEMGFKVAQKHSKKLRKIFLICGFMSTLTMAIAIVFVGWVGQLMAVAGFILMALGVVVERWLFFAEAKHDQALYYGG